MLSSVLALTLSVAIPMHLQAFPSDHPTLRAGERWAYEVDAPHGVHRTGRIELSVFGDDPRQRAIARLPGLAVAELVGRPRAVLFALMLARGPVFGDVVRTAEEARTPAEVLTAVEVKEDEPAAALAWLLHASVPHLDALCESRWTGERWAKGSRCGEIVVSGACRVGARGGVRVEASLAFKTYVGTDSRNRNATLEACVDPALALPLSVTVRDGGEVRLAARLAEQGPAARAEQRGPVPAGLWPVWPPEPREEPFGPGRAIELGDGEAQEARLERLLTAKPGPRYCTVAPLRIERRGDLVAIYAARPRRVGGALVHAAAELRVDGSGLAARLVADDGGRERVLEPLDAYRRARCEDFESIPVTWRERQEDRIRAEEERRLTPLHQAIERDDLAAVRRLLDAGALIDALPARPPGYPQKMYGATPLRLAAEYGYSDIAALLLDRGADPNAHVAPHQFASQPLLPHEQPPLFAAIKKGHADVVALLLARGARWDFGTKKQPHALAVAVWDPRIYAMLLAAGAPAGYREVYEAVQRKDAAALRAALSDGRWAEDARRLANAEWWREGVTLAQEAKRAR